MLLLMVWRGFFKKIIKTYAYFNTFNAFNNGTLDIFIHLFLSF